MRYGILVLILGLCSAFSSPEESCSGYYAKGNAAYESASYTQAIQFYESCLNEGFESWVVYYNLGNAWYRTGTLGKVILNYEKSLLLNPGEPDVKANLEFVRALIQDKQEELQGSSVLDTWYRYMTLNTSAIAVLIAVGVLFICIAGLVLMRGPIRFMLYPVIIGLSFTLVLVSASIGFRLYQIHSVSHGVLLDDATSVMSGPGSSFEVLFEIHEGTTFEIIDAAEGWTSVNLGGGKMGYIPSPTIGVIH